MDSQVLDETELTNLRVIFAWAICGILILTVFVNLVFAFVTVGYSAFKYIKRKITNWKKAENKYLEPKSIAVNNSSKIEKTRSTDQTKVEADSFEQG